MSRESFHIEGYIPRNVSVKDVIVPHTQTLCGGGYYQLLRFNHIVTNTLEKLSDKRIRITVTVLKSKREDTL